VLSLDLIVKLVNGIEPVPKFVPVGYYPGEEFRSWSMWD